jgi:hypothetical protein
MNGTPPASGRLYLLIGAAWLAAAVIAGVSGRTAELVPPAPQVVLVLLTGTVVIAFASRERFRRWIACLDIRVFPCFHLTRFVGIYFLVLHGRGDLPYAFAVPGGWGDILVAASALLLLALPGGIGGRPGLLLAWNLFGLLDILFVVATATRLALGNPTSMAALMQFPLSLLPTFLVPLIIASHLMLFWRLRQAHATPSPHP